MRRDQPANADAKYCSVCGRLISPHVRNYQERKYCSKTCSSTRLTDIDNEIEQTFIDLAVKNGSVECGTVQELIGKRIGRYGTPETASELSQQQKTDAGNDEAAFRERVRRAARRVVVNGYEDKRFVCWSQNQIAEPSFAKGEWSVKYIKQ